MGKSPGKWVKNVHFGKKSPKSVISKDATTFFKDVNVTSDTKTSFTINSPANNVTVDSPVISSPFGQIFKLNEEQIQLAKRSSPNLMPDKALNDNELNSQLEAATKVQAAFRGYLGRRAFWELKGIIRLQALIRGDLVRRQVLHGTRAIVELQGVVRGQIVRLSRSFPIMLQKGALEEHVENEQVDLFQTSLELEKPFTAAFGVKEKEQTSLIQTSPEFGKLSKNTFGVKALEQGVEGVILKTEDVETVFELKEYFDKRDKEGSQPGLTKATITGVELTGMGDRVCVDLCSLMKPGEGLLVGSFARGLFLVHSESNHITTKPFRVNAGPVHAYVAVPGGKTCYLSELKAGKEIIVVDQSGIQRTAVVGRVKIETRPLIVVDAKVDSDKETSYTILLENGETVGLVPSTKGGGNNGTAIAVTSLKVGDKVLVSVQGGGAKHTGIEI